MKPALPKLMLLLCTLPGLALAHTGAGQTAGFLHGLSHPIGGMDHLLAMVAVGLWAAQMGGRALWIVPCTFVGAMILGGAAGFSALPLPFIEQGILASVLVLGLLIAFACRLPLPYSVTLVGVFALFHGYAHGAEMPAALGAASYVAGFTCATATLHAAGMGIGLILQKMQLQALTRLTGGTVALAGLYGIVA
jgi:urease accessory protein